MFAAFVMSRRRSQQEDDYDDESEGDESGPKKNMRVDEEDQFIKIILTHFAQIENKTTDKSLTSKNVETQSANIWTTVQEELYARTNVSFFNTNTFLFIDG